MDSSLSDLLNRGQLVDLTIVDCALITLSDKAFERKQNLGETQWDQKHLGIALKFAGESPEPRWHCIWATLQEHDESLGICVFRTYDDVYLERLQRSPTKQSPTKRAPTKRRHRALSKSFVPF